MARVLFDAVYAASGFVQEHGFFMAFLIFLFVLIAGSVIYTREQSELYHRMGMGESAESAKPENNKSFNGAWIGYLIASTLIGLLIWSAFAD